MIDQYLEWLGYMYQIYWSVRAMPELFAVYYMPFHEWFDEFGTTSSDELEA
jgi:hypothetical protein